MAYIYQITNDVNGKIYIGKTEFSIQKRFQEHCHDSQKDTQKHRPLYAAMRKYGIEHFHIELIEETDNSEERERYWIERKGSFKAGYNATLGGDGKRYIDYDLVVATYKEINNIEQTAKMLNISRDSVSNILKQRNVPIKWDIHEFGKRNQELYGKKCIALDKTTKSPIKTFASLREAARYIIELGLSKDKEPGIKTHIHNVCEGKRKTAYGFIWKYLDS